MLWTQNALIFTAYLGLDVQDVSGQISVLHIDPEVPGKNHTPVVRAEYYNHALALDYDAPNGLAYQKTL